MGSQKSPPGDKISAISFDKVQFMLYTFSMSTTELHPQESCFEVVCSLLPPRAPSSPALLSPGTAQQEVEAAEARRHADNMEILGHIRRITNEMTYRNYLARYTMLAGRPYFETTTDPSEPLDGHIQVPERRRRSWGARRRPYRPRQPKPELHA